jgi:hypothetical protein
MGAKIRVAVGLGGARLPDVDIFIDAYLFVNLPYA